jgi:transglutaminase-like putative cysteine protease
VTDVLTRPHESAGSGAPETPHPVGDWARETTSRLDLSDVGALTLTAVTATAALGLGRLFKDGSFVLPLLVAVVVTHGIAVGARRLRLGFGLSTVLSLAGMVLTVIWVVEPHTTTYGFPGGATWQAIGHDLSRAWQRFGEVVAPAPVTRGFLLSAIIGTWAAGAAADSAAFRLGAPFEATIPSFTLFVFGAVLGADRHRVGYTVAYFAAVLLFLLVHGSVRRSERLSWFAGRTRGGARSIVQGGLVLVVIAVVAALLLGPGLPGAKSDSLISWRPQRENGPSSRVTVSPLVDIRTRLVDQSDRDAFTVDSTVPAYWRLTALDKFDGQIWSSIGTYRPAGNKLPSTVVNKATKREALQRFSVTGLSSIWLPAAYEPERFADAQHIRYDADSASLLAEAASSDGLTYKVTSGVSVVTAEQLSAVRPVAPKDITSRYLELPTDFPQSVAALAAKASGLDRARCATVRCTPAELTSQNLGPYQRARALQDFLRANYAYDLRVAPGHDIPALERFLFQTKRGYCEQFAGAFAAMARSVGLPSRVAVGFTPGDIQAANSFRVRGKHAHAWPEVYLDGYGWVAFEPTPGRGMPGAEAYTGVTPPPLVNIGVTTPTTVPQTTGAPASAATTTSTTQPARNPAHSHGTALWRRLLVIALVLLVIGAVLGAAPLAHVWRRQRRRAAAVTPGARVLLAWTEATERLAVAGHPKKRWETAAEYVRRVSRSTPRSAEPLSVLAEETSAVTFSAAEPSREAATRAEDAAAAVDADVRTSASTWQRLRWAVDPRPLLQRREA